MRYYAKQHEFYVLRKVMLWNQAPKIPHFPAPMRCETRARPLNPAFFIPLPVGASDWRA